MKTETSTGGVLAKLQAHKAATTGEASFTLPATGIVVTYPLFRGYDDWAKAQRLAGDDGAMINLYYIILICRFDGETLMANDYRELVPAGDHLAISGKLFGSPEAKVDAKGNG